MFDVTQLIAENAALKAENGALREIAAAVVEADDALLHSDWECAFCDSMGNSEHENEHTATCVVTRARALLSHP